MSKLEVADIFRRHGDAWRTANAGHLSHGQLRVMSAIEACRTAALGGHVERCEDCSSKLVFRHVAVERADILAIWASADLRCSRSRLGINTLTLLSIPVQIVSS